MIIATFRGGVQALTGAFNSSEQVEYFTDDKSVNWTFRHLILLNSCFVNSHNAKNSYARARKTDKLTNGVGWFRHIWFLVLWLSPLLSTTAGLLWKFDRLRFDWANKFISFAFTYLIFEFRLYIHSICGSWFKFILLYIGTFFLRWTLNGVLKS